MGKIELGQWRGILLGEADARWLAVADERLEGAMGFKSVEQVNRDVNRMIQYRSEEKDVWSPPQETWDRGYGDCEDIALVKRAVLLEAGFSEDEIAMVLVWDRINHCDHAILCVMGFVMDLGQDTTPRWTESLEYIPQFGFCGHDRYIFGRALT